ncbi:DOMON domain-containing protein [Thermococcus sp.]|uniref:DOMON domain-containing protein n=1 Tax=Thermococcus sp. TaxID=35749 RepID=UPI002610F5FC|nr:DOMON domain-containing protein [Thermococcus sp.]
MTSKKLGIVAILLVVVFLGGCIGSSTGKYGTTASSSTSAVTSTSTSTSSSVATSSSPVLSPWKADGVIEKNEYPHELSLAGGKFTVYWRNDDEYLYMALKGKTTGWVAIGFEPSTAMKDADMIIGWVKDGKATVVDAYSTGLYGPHPPDEKLGGSNDILEYSGKEENGYTVIEFKRKLNTGDKYDKAFKPGQEIKFIFAMADADDFTAKHNVAKGSGKLKLDG